MKDLKNHSDACASVNTNAGYGFAKCDCHKKNQVIKILSFALVMYAIGAAFNPAYCPEDKVRVSKGWAPNPVVAWIVSVFK